MSLLSVSSSQADSINQQPEVEDEPLLATTDLVAEAVEEDSAVDDAAIIQLPDAHWPETETVDLESSPEEGTASMAPLDPEEFLEWEVPEFLQGLPPRS
ncbi:hypothetical protein ACIRPH_01280 [Nocardiopsis sp. NPDC101807]|uniref:hypothetical protein n=1 Tax=Nocardiopsis sp. NPDC101807 TaxID=3364339 RepID=UPI003818CCD3